MNKKELLEEFVEFLKDSGEDAFWVFDNTEEVIEQFLHKDDKYELSD